jgi:hypothetical protein
MATGGASKGLVLAMMEPPANIEEEFQVDGLRRLYDERPETVQLRVQAPGAFPKTS